MEKTLIVANWKENKTVEEAKEWLEKFSIFNDQFSNNLEIVICPSYVILPMMAGEISKLEGVKLGAQDVSKFGEGQYTGEVSAKQLSDFVSYVIVGHSERRKHFDETDEDVRLKVGQCLKYGLTPIICVSSTQELIPFPSEFSSDRSQIIVYEPTEAISSEGQFHPDDPEHAQSIAKKIKSEVGRDTKVLYGGSINSGNVESFVNQPDINGVLVGQASLDAVEFSRIIFNSF